MGLCKSKKNKSLNKQKLLELDLMAIEDNESYKILPLYNEIK